MTDNNVNDLIRQRGEVYGSFQKIAFVCQCFKTIARNAPSWEKMTRAQQEAMEMILHKVTRILCGDPNHVDSWADIAGYAQLIVTNN